MERSGGGATGVRVLYFSRDYTTHDRRFLEALVGAGHETWFLRLEDDGFEYEARPVPAGVRIAEWAGGRAPVGGPAGWLQLMPDLQRVIADVQPDVIHAGPVPSCGFMAAMSGFSPLFVMSWGSDLLVDTMADPAQAFTATYALSRASAFVCDCDAVRARAHTLMHGTLPAVVQFPWGVDLSVFAPGDRDRHRAALGLGPGPVIVSTRLWEEHYGILTVIEAVGRARRQVPDLQLLLLGDGSQRDRVQELIARWDLQRAVTTPGLVSPDALAPYFQAADMYLTCTHSDGASISLLEAMACGLPVVASDIPGNREWLDGQAGSALVPVGDVEAFAAALLATARLAPTDLVRVTKAHRARVEHGADWSRNFLRLTRAYTATMNATPGVP